MGTGWRKVENKKSPGVAGPAHSFVGGGGHCSRLTRQLYAELTGGPEAEVCHETIKVVRSWRQRKGRTGKSREFCSVAADRGAGFSSRETWLWLGLKIWSRRSNGAVSATQK